MEENFEAFLHNHPEALLSEAVEKFKSLNPQITDKKQLRDAFYNAVYRFYQLGS